MGGGQLQMPVHKLVNWLMHDDTPASAAGRVTL